MSAAPRRLSISSLLCDDEPIPKPARSPAKADKPFFDGDPTNAPLNGPGFSPLAQDGVVRGPPRLVPTSHPSEPIRLIDTNVAVPPPPTVFPRPPQSHSSSALSSRSLNPRSMEAVLEQAASSSRSQHSQSARTSSRSPTVKRTSLSLSTSIPGDPRSTAFSPPANVTSEPQPLSASVSPISPQGSHNALDILLRAAEVEANYTRAREERRRSTGDVEPAPYLTPAPALPPTPSSSANASVNQQQVQQHRGPDLMQRSLSGPSRSRSQSQSRSRHSRQQQHQSQTSPQEDTDEWLLDQLGDERPASPPPASPASSSAPSRAPSRASGAKKTKPKPKPKARESASTKKKPPPKSVSMDVDDELLSLVGESSSGAICDREVSESIDAELLATSSGSPAPGPEDATMPPPPNPGTADKPKPKPMPKKKPATAVKPRTTLLPKRQSKPSAKVKAAKEDVPATSPVPVPAPAAATAKGKKATTAAKKSTTDAASRSRSGSTMPATASKPGADRPTPQAEAEAEGDGEEDEEDEEDDDRLYCMCQKRWDDGQMMIGCDMCDGWYHPKCIKMENHWVELMDVFVCPNCAANPAVSKTTTWKPRCLNGLSSANPSSKDACHKPKRSDGSKFCSDTCGMEYMSTRIDGWVSCGGDRAHLWESVKGAPRREGFVAVVPLAPEGEQIVEIVPQGPDQTLEQSYKSSDAARAVVQPAHDRVQREVGRLESQISGWKERQLEQQQELKIVSWRIQLLARASRRADAVGECGWDQRLCYGDEEWLEFGEGVLESYDVEQGGADQDHADEFGQWWCPAPKKCNRHAGWQKLRSQDLAKEKELKEEAFMKLKARETDSLGRIKTLLASKVSRLIGIDQNGDSGRGKKRKAD